MKTDFAPAQLSDPAMVSSEAIIRSCVHCGFCTATCPTYLLLGDERDSPRGRIYLIKDMLENNRAPSRDVVDPLDRCLSCLSCMTTCPSDVHYMHLVDHARAYIEENYRRPLGDRVLRALLAFILPYPGRFRAALALARAVKPLVPLFRRLGLPGSFIAMLELVPDFSLRDVRGDETLPTVARRGRAILLRGCAESVLQPAIGAAAKRALEREGYEVVVVRGETCCGSLVHHMGREADAAAAARRNIDAWTAEIEKGDIVGIVSTAAGCGTTLKNYGFLLRNDRAYARKAEAVSSLARDISELVEVPSSRRSPAAAAITVAYHSACSLQHGQKIHERPMRLLAAAGFAVASIPEGHLCCGSAGVYNILQPDIAGRLRSRKLEHIERLAPDIVAAGNIGCIVQLSQAAGRPVVHTIELLDWAGGGPIPAACRTLSQFAASSE